MDIKSETPLQSDAKFIIDRYDDSTEVCLYNGGKFYDVAYSTTIGKPVEHFIWLVESAAAFHKIPVEKKGF